MRLLSRPRFRPSRGRAGVSLGLDVVVRFVCVIRVPVCARVSRVCPVCVPAPPGVFLPVSFYFVDSTWIQTNRGMACRKCRDRGGAGAGGSFDYLHAPGDTDRKSSLPTMAGPFSFFLIT